MLHPRNRTCSLLATKACGRSSRGKTIGQNKNAIQRLAESKSADGEVTQEGAKCSNTGLGSRGGFFLPQWRTTSEKGRKSERVVPLYFFWAGNILKELPGLWSSTIKDLTFSLPTLLRFTIENQLSLWRACLLGRDLWRERKRSSVFLSIVHWKCSLNSTQHTKVTTQKDPCVALPPILPMWLIAFWNQLRDRGSNQPIPQNLRSLIRPTLQYLHDISEEWQQHDEKLEISINPTEIPPN